MGDPNDLSTDVSIHNESTNVAVTTTTDGVKERFDVDAVIRPSGNPYGNGSPVHAFDYQSDADKNETMVTHTVPTGKIFYIYQWGFSGTGTNVMELQIDSVAKDGMWQDDSSSNQRGQNRVTYVFPIKAVAGEVVRIQKVSLGGLNNKNIYATISGIEVGA